MGGGLAERDVRRWPDWKRWPLGQELEGHISLWLALSLLPGCYDMSNFPPQGSSSICVLEPADHGL